MPSNHLILSHPLLLLPSIFPSVRVFSSESVLHITWPKYWSFSFSISLSNEYSGLISFRMDWLDFLAVQGTLKSLLQHHSSKSINTSALSFLYSPTLTVKLIFKNSTTTGETRTNDPTHYIHESERSLKKHKNCFVLKIHQNALHCPQDRVQTFKHGIQGPCYLASPNLLISP